MNFLKVSVILGMGLFALIIFQSIQDFSLSRDVDQPVEILVEEKEFETQGYGVSSSNRLAVSIGMDILEQGGNAVDAAVAVAFALGVVEPYGSGLGGGGIMLVHSPDKEEPVVYDYRENAPLEGQLTNRHIGVPGFVKGMETVYSELGSGLIRIEELIEPSVQLAENGFQIGSSINERLRGARGRINPVLASDFFPGGNPIEPGSVLRQPELANTLRGLQERGLNDFYEGQIAEQLAAARPELHEEDLKAYEVLKGEVVKGSFAGYHVYSAGAPVAGITLIQMLQMAELMNIQNSDSNHVDNVHLLGEIAKRAYQNRLDHIGDPSFNEIDQVELTSINYSHQLASTINLDKLSSGYLLDDLPEGTDSSNTTHFVVIDKDGMVVSATNTLSNFYGSGAIVNGFFLNDQMKNFNSDVYSPNYLERGKRPRSFLTPTILVREDNQEIIGIGTPGGARIPMMLLQVLIDHLIFETPLQVAIDKPRFFIDNNNLYVEEDFPNEIRHALRDRGYSTFINNSDLYYGSIQAVGINFEEKRIFGGADRRRAGTFELNDSN